MIKVFILALLVYIISAQWQTIERTNLIASRGVQGYDFDTKASEIKFRMTCTRSCDMFLISVPQFERLKQGLDFTFFWGEKGRTDSGLMTYSQVNNIRNKVLAVVVNPDRDFSLTANFELRWYIPQSGPVWEKMEFNDKVAPKGFQGRDFSKTASVIRFTLSTTADVDMYLMEPAEIENLRQGRGFNYLWRALRTRSQTHTYSDTAKISQTVVAVVVNAYSADTVDAKFLLEWQNAGSPLGALIIIAIVAAVLVIFCCCCCFGSAAYGGKRYYYVQHYDSGYHQGYHIHGNSGGYSTGYGSGGGNSYSGNVGGSNSGGHSGGYGSGGNSYN